MAVSFFWRQVFKRSVLMDIETTGLDPSRHAPLGAAHATFTGPVQETWFTYETATRGQRGPYYRKFGIKTEEAIKETMEPFAKRMWKSAWEKARIGWLQRGGQPERATKYFSKVFARTARKGQILWTHNVRFDITQFGSQFAHPRAQQLLYEGAAIPGWNAWDPVSGRLYPTSSKGMYEMKSLLFEHPRRAAAVQKQWYAAYRRMVKDIAKSGKPAILDSLAITQAMFGMAQQQGAMAATGDIFTGSSLEALSAAFKVKVVGDPHLATTDVRTLRKLMPRIIETTEALYKGKKLKGWQAEALYALGKMQPEIAELNMERMFAQAQREMIDAGKYRLKSGRYSTDLDELVQIYEDIWQGRSYYREGIVQETMTRVKGLAEPQLDQILLEKAKIPQMGESVVAGGRVTRRMATLRRFMAGRNPLLVAGIAAGAGIIAGAMMLPDRKKHTTVEALKDDNMASQYRHILTEFASGYVPRLHPEIAKWREETWKDKAKKAQVKEEIEKIQAKMAKKFGRLNPDDFSYGIPLSLIEGLNTGRRDLRFVNMEKFRIQVEDADTIFLERRGTLNWLKGRFGYGRIPLRLSGVDAPEVRHEDDPLQKFKWENEQPFGREAVAIFKGLIESSKNINIVATADPVTYGRHLAVIADEHGENINLELIRQGAAKALPWGHPHLELMKRDLAQAAEEQARDEREGIWDYKRYRSHANIEAVRNQEVTFASLASMPRVAGSPYKYGEMASDLYLEGMSEQGIAAHLRKIVTDFGSQHQGIMALGKWVLRKGTQEARKVMSRAEIKDLLIHLKSTISESKAALKGYHSLSGEMTDAQLLEGIATLRKLRAARGVVSGVSEARASLASIVQKQQRIKKSITNAVRRGDIPPQSAVRTTTIKDLEFIIAENKLREGMSFEGRAGISATQLTKNPVIPFYGGYEAEPIAIIAKERHLIGRGQAVREVLIDPKVDVKELKFALETAENKIEILNFKQMQARMTRQRAGDIRSRMTKDIHRANAPVKPPNVRCDDSPGVEGYVQRQHRGRKGSHRM